MASARWNKATPQEERPNARAPGAAIPTSWASGSPPARSEPLPRGARHRHDIDTATATGGDWEESKRLRDEGRWEDLIEQWLAEIELLDGQPTRVAEILGRIAVVFRDELGDPAQAFDALLESFRVAPARASKQQLVELEQLAREQGRFRELVDTGKSIVASALDGRGGATVPQHLHEIAADDGPGPGSADVERELAVAELLIRWCVDGLREPAYADDLVARIRAVDPTHPAVQRRMAALYGERGEWDAQIDALERASLRATSDEQRRDLEIQLGDLYEQSLGRARGDRADLARRHYERALKLDPQAYRALEGLCALARADEKPKEVAALLERMVDAAPDHHARVSALLQLAHLHEKEFIKPAQAAAKYELLLALEPAHKEAVEGAVRCYVATRDFDALRRALARRADATPDGKQRARVLLQIARVSEENLGDLEGAAQALTSARQADPKSRRVLFELARVAEKREDWATCASMRVELAERTGDPATRAQIYVGLGELLAPADRDPLAARLHFERAVSLDPKLVGAWEAIQSLAASHGDRTRAAQALENRAELTEAPRARAQLLVELAQLRARELRDTRGARLAYEQALEADPSNEAAARALLDAYVDEEHWAEALPICETLATAAARAGDAPRAMELLRLGARAATLVGDRRRALLALVGVWQLDADGEAKTGVGPGASSQDAAAGEAARALRRELVQAAHELCADDPLALARAAVALDDVARHTDDLDVEDTFRLGEIQLARGDADAGHALLEAVLERDPEHAGALRAFATMHDMAGQWLEAARFKERLAQVTPAREERLRLFIEAAELLAHRVGDLEAAAHAFEEARALDPSDHWILHTQLWLYTQLEKWPMVAKTLREIADNQTERAKKAKTVFTMAQVVDEKIGDPRWAADLFEEVMDIEPSRLDAFERIVRTFTELKDWEALAAAYEDMVKRLARPGAAASLELKHAICHQLGLVYRDRLADARRALAAFRAALTLKPAHDESRKIVAELYVLLGDLDGAVAVTREALQRDPFAGEPMRELYALFLRQHRFDKAWCVVDVLAHRRDEVGPIDAEQTQFHASYPSADLSEIPGTLAPAAWRSHIVHPELDPVVGQVFRAILPAIVRAKAAALPASLRGATGPMATEPHCAESYRVVQAVKDAAEVLGVPAPEVRTRLSLNVPFAPAISESPALHVSLDLARALSPVALAFLVGKHVALLQPELYARALFPSVEELKSLVRAAVRAAGALGAGGPASMGPASPFDATLLNTMRPEEAHALRAAVGSVLQSGATLDVRRWSQLADISASRAGLLLAGSIEGARRGNMMEVRGPGDLPPREWLAEMVQFATTDTYADLRAAIGVGVGADAAV